VENDNYTNDSDDEFMGSDVESNSESDKSYFWSFLVFVASAKESREFYSFIST
jgi:hypothetical protein